MTQPRRIDPLPLGGGEDGFPYSKGLMARALMATGVSAIRAYELALRVEGDLRARDEKAVTLERLHELAVASLGSEDGERAMRRLRRFGELRSLELPVIVLVGGATGTGKSTVATEVAHRLGITRVTSTDFVRQTMRAFFTEEFLPSVHYSSFDAGAALPTAEREHGDPVLLGFLDQTRHVLVGVRASLERALEEGWSTVLEGVHLVPGMVQPIEGALNLHVVVAVDDEEEHRRHFSDRGALTAGIRGHEKYVDNLADIRKLQRFIVREAEREGVPVVESGNIEHVIGTVIDLIFERAAALQASA